MRFEHWFYTIPLRLRSLFRRGQVEQELDDELQYHLTQKTDQYIAQGMRAPEARQAALRDMDGLEQHKEECRDTRRVNFVEDLLKDLRFGLRQLRCSPGFAVVAVLTLALGIGASTAIFSMVNGILLSSMPYPEPQRLYLVREDFQLGAQLYPGSVDNGGNFLMWRRHCHSFEGIAALEPVNDNLDFGKSALQVHGTRASANLFSILGVRPQLGRTFTEEEDQLGRNREVILTDAFWRARFNSDPQIIGKAVRFNGYDFIVVGVLPADFYFPRYDQLTNGPIAGWTYHVDYFVPLALRPGESKPSAGSDFNFTVIARLKPGITRAQALADLDAVEADISRHDPQAHGAVVRGNLVPLKAAVVGDAAKTLWILMAGVGLVLLIVSVNLASLLMARSMGRTHEVAVRAALGASRWRLLRQFLIEGVLLVTAGGALGFLLAVDGLRLIIYSAPSNIPRLESIQVDRWVLIFSVAVSVLAGALFSVLPGLRLSRTEAGEALKSSAATTSAARATARLRDLLAGAEVALCTVLLIAALLLAKSLRKVLRENSWLEVQHVLAVDLIAPSNNYGTYEKLQQLYESLLAKVQSLPGVRAAGFSNALPLRGELWTESFHFEEGPVLEFNPDANIRFFSPGYFHAIGLPLVQGRFPTDGEKGQAEVVLSEGYARAVLPGRNPIGTHLRWRHPDTGKPLLCTVVGVVGEARAEADQKAPFMVYFPYWLGAEDEISLVVRTAADPRSTAAEIRTLLRGLDPLIPIAGEQTMADIVSEAVAPRRFVVTLGILFASFATFLAALGLYGVISLSVAQRTHEIGIRMSLGARRWDVLRMVVARGLKLALAGLAAGLAFAFLLTRLITSLLYGVKPTDPASFAAVCLVLGGVAALASYIPARRATKVDPMVSLRYE
jgi:predicted permease